MQLKSRPWRLFLLVVSALYLVPEAIFNAQLVSLIGLGTPEPLAMEHLEIYGRTVSGIGVTLLLADLLPARFFKTPLKGAVSMLVLTSCIWPSVFFGQKLLIERWLIQPSSAEQRQYAAYSAALRDALAINAVEVQGLDYDTAATGSSENLTFLALFGGLAYSDHNLAKNLDAYKHDIIGNFVQKQAYRDFDQHYQDFSELYKELSAHYQQYAQGSNRYNQALAQTPARQAQYWQSLEQEVNQGWSRYQQAQKAHIAKASARAQEYGPKIYRYFEDRADCKKRYDKAERRNRCYTKQDANYKAMINKAGIGNVDANYWLIVEDVSTTENITNTVLTGVLTGGLTTALQALNWATGGDGGFKDKRYKYTDSPDHYQQRFLAHPNFQALFSKETGYPFDIANLAAFRSHPHTQVKLRRAIKAKGLDLPASWTINDKPLFDRTVAAKVKAEADQRWQQEMAARGLSLPINLSWDAFQQHPQIQARIADRMGDLYVKGVRADWNRANFKRHVLDPNIERRTQHYLAMLAESQKEFADGGRFADAGKQALRSVVIPPISMSLSLFLICMTFIKLPFKALQLARPAGESAASKAKAPWQRWASLGAALLPPLLVLALPVLLVQNRYTQAPNSAVNYFLTKVEESSNLAFSYALRWTLHAQPLLHPLGRSLEAHMGIYRAFAPLAHGLAAIDLQPDEWAKVQKPVLKDVALTINTNAAKAQVRIMNISPRFEQGMHLKPGNYDIQVTAPGYRPYRQWHILPAGEQALAITLSPL